MSISPHDAKGPATSPHLRSAPPNPNPRHGSSPRLRPRSPPRPRVGWRPTGDAAAARSGNEGSTVTADGSYESANNLEQRKVEECSHDSISGTIDLDNIIDGRDAVSGSSDQRTDSLHGGKRMGGIRSPHPHFAPVMNGHGNIAQSGSRKNQMVSANHLLNFQYDPIQRPLPRPAPSRKPRKVRPFNRDLFLQANYRFVVLDTGNYFTDLMDPDKMLDWDDIVCVSYSTPSLVQCPICLESPLCPQITSCGHIYCFPCILRYLLTGQEDHRGECWKKCPLCFMMISPKDLYTITINHLRRYDVGDDVKFSLLTRKKNSFVPHRKNTTEEPVSGSFDFLDSYSKFMLTSDVELSVREAKSSLNEWLAKADAGLVDDLEKLPYVCAALEHLEQRMKVWVARKYLNSSSMELKGNETVTAITSQSASSSNNENADPWSCTDKMMIHTETDEPIEPFYVVNEIYEQKDPKNIDCFTESVQKLSLSPSSLTELGSSDRGKDAVDGDEYVFYQVADGQHIILHPLNMKCLLYHFKNNDLLPSEVGGKILQMDTITQTEAVRHRFRFLSHFSLTTTFQFCEIDLREMLPPEAFSPCIDQIKKRERERKHAARKERQSRTLSEHSRVTAVPLPCYLQASRNDTSFSLDDFEALGNIVAPSTSPPVTGDRKLFSDVTRLGFAAAHDSPSLSTEEHVPPTTTTLEGLDHGPSTPALSFANVIATTRPVEVLEPRLNTLGKKGKKPTRVLLSTAGGRRY